VVGQVAIDGSFSLAAREGVVVSREERSHERSEPSSDRAGATCGGDTAPERVDVAPTASALISRDLVARPVRVDSGRRHRGDRCRGRLTFTHLPAWGMPQEARPPMLRGHTRTPAGKAAVTSGTNTPVIIMQRPTTPLLDQVII
jgi:hypothetical protein